MGRSILTVTRRPKLVPGTGPDAPSVAPAEKPETAPAGVPPVEPPHLSGDPGDPPAAPGDTNARPFGDRRPGRGNRLRRGLRSRRKAFRQREPRS